MCVGRAAAKRAAPSVGDHRVGAAPVRRAALAAHEALALEPVDEPRHAAAREQRRIGQLAHAQVLVAALVEHEQHLVLGHREPVRLLELGVERREHARVRAQEPAPGCELAARELGPVSLSPCSNFTAAIGAGCSRRAAYCGAVAEVTYLEAIRSAMADAMRDDERVFLIGEDVGHFGGPVRRLEGAARGVRRGARDRHADRRGGLRRRGLRRGLDGRAADRRAAVRRLHLVRVRPDRDGRRQDALAQRHQAAGRDPLAVRRRRARRAVPRELPGGLLRRHRRAQGRLPGQRRGRLRAAAQRDRGRRPGALLRAQGALPPPARRGARDVAAHADRARAVVARRAPT